MLTESLDVVSVGFVVVYIDSGVGSGGMGMMKGNFDIAKKCDS